jgi:hypothetical protein
MLFKECDSLDAAFGWARHLAASGRVPLLIEGDDGTRLDRRDIAAALPQAGTGAAEPGPRTKTAAGSSVGASR